MVTALCVMLSVQHAVKKAHSLFTCALYVSAWMSVSGLYPSTGIDLCFVRACTPLCYIKLRVIICNSFNFLFDSSWIESSSMFKDRWIGLLPHRCFMNGLHSHQLEGLTTLSAASYTRWIPALPISCSMAPESPLLSRPECQSCWLVQWCWDM